MDKKFQEINDSLDAVRSLINDKVCKINKEILELTEIEEDEEDIKSLMQNLTGNLKQKDNALEKVIIKLLSSELKSWLNLHLAPIVKEVVENEIKKIIKNNL